MSQGQKKENNDKRNTLKAEIMFKNRDYIAIKEQCNQVWCDRAQAKDLPPMNNSTSTVDLTPKQIEEAARQFAVMIISADAKRKLRSLENLVSATVIPEEQYYAIARLYPKMATSLQAAVKEIVKQHHKRIPSEQFARLIHMIRIFFEAKIQGFDLRGGE
jgi:hypothetical protein